jgi:hypothetical protein
MIVISARAPVRLTNEKGGKRHGKSGQQLG